MYSTRRKTAFKETKRRDLKSNVVIHIIIKRRAVGNVDQTREQRKS